MKVDFVILGATGMQGRIVARDLHEKGYALLLCDKNDAHKHKLSYGLQGLPFETFDLRDHEKMVAVFKRFGADIVINCALDDYVLEVLRACIEAGVHSIDLGSYSDVIASQFALDSALKKKNLLSITGCGAVPGIGNVMLKYAAKKFDTIHTIETGFSWDSNIKTFVVPFSMDGILWEFTEPAPILENGKLIKKMPLETLKKRKIRGIGDQMVMCVDHAEPYTFNHYFGAKGLRNARFYAGFPKHSFETIQTLVNVGVVSWDHVKVDGGEVYPIDVIVETLRRLPIPEGYEEVENLWVDIHGEKDGRSKVVKMECIAPTLEGWKEFGCNIDTGFPASIIAQFIKKGMISKAGMHAPEGIVPEKEFFMELIQKGMTFYENGRMINQEIIKNQGETEHQGERIPHILAQSNRPSKK